MTTRSKKESENSSNDRALEEKFRAVFSKDHDWSDPIPWDTRFHEEKVNHRGLEPGNRICLICGRFEDVLKDETGAIWDEECEKKLVWSTDLATYDRVLNLWRKHKKTTTSK